MLPIARWLKRWLSPEAHDAAPDFAVGIETAIGEAPARVHRPSPELAVASTPAPTLLLAPARTLVRMARGVQARLPWGSRR